MSSKKLIGRKNAGYEIVAAVQKPISKHLYTVLGYKSKEFVVWTYDERNDSFAAGNYFHFYDWGEKSAKRQAMKVFRERSFPLEVETVATV